MATQMFSKFITAWKDRVKNKQVQPVTQTPYQTAQNMANQQALSFDPYQADITKRQEEIKNSPYLAEYAKARELAKSGIQSQYGLAKEGLRGQYDTAQGERQNAMNRAIAAQGGASSGQALRLESESRAGLEAQRAKSMTELERQRAEQETQALGQIDVAEAQDRTRRMERAEELGIQKYQFDSGLNFEQQSLGMKMVATFNELEQAKKESVFNQLIALREAGIKPGDVERLRPLFEGLRVDMGRQTLPGTTIKTPYTGWGPQPQYSGYGYRT